ncbi:transferrin-binding protein-like solute binding protein [Neisseria gonorrhoeae]|uniref:transferrin-binding protein-like solute binding protein n=1 Tax=Neisseria gonorrhoeae TaxID=485 RepID=UPI0020002018|nr:transferrin-binding protein-like solute binding protein [Neisseria gonorrhoeae]MCK2139162.1 transferrin-binding protein-like solute binding protein [Neisseria gonorrhoeae]MCK2147120.1 transferrin-binding protein-like solute binding protein [Neisseria gonorrhoeae]MCK2192777.1 transferrin-binding protein-like solute binding protein [Neisseria gonorrhoeae]MCK2197718.1 transferrin-binding protein-like solute binding protein [Neisseria gonorrhoeae]MCK2203424.1 transferrin-binding protein-like so
MNNPLVNQAAMVLPVFLLSACLGGGGSFDLDSVDTEAPRPAPKYQDVPSKKPEARKDQGGYGFAMRFKRRNWYPPSNPKENEIRLSEGDWEQTDNGDIKKPSKQKDIINALSGNGGELLQDSSQRGKGISKVTDHHDFKYVWSGFFYKQIGNTVKKSGSSITEARNGPDGYIFYKGKDPSRELPVLGSVEYKGTWDFLTDVRVNQKFTDLGSASTKSGDRYSAFSGELDYIVKKQEDKKEKHKGLGLTTEITVDFEKKNLNGKLIKNNYVINNNNGDDQNKYTTEYYTLDATLRGNRFSGKATATDKSSDGQAKQHPFVSDSSSLSGGFFGPQGEELGFRFLSDDGKVAVVGSAKTKDKNANGNTAAAGTAGAAGMSSEDTRLTTVLDAVELTLDGKKIKDLDNFSDATRLVVDGIMIPLLPNDSGSGGSQADKGKNGGTAFTYETTYTPESYTPESDKKDTKAGTAANGVQTVSNTAGGTSGKTKTHYKVQVCCSNLNYLKYGLLTRENNNSVMQAVKNSNRTADRTAQGAQSMFLQGERTDEKEIPKDENVVYLGTWYGHIATNGTSWTREASNQENGNRAKFDVNFKDKRITGTLTAENRSEATFTIDAMIDGNGFKGTAKTGNDGFAPDQNSSTGTYKVHIANAEVQGGFYGPNAEELGGWFAYPGNGQAKNAQASSGSGNSAGSATVVFGAKRQRLVK